VKAYGYRRGDDLTSDPLGAPTRCQKQTSKYRTACRRILHKQGRNDGKRQIAEQLR
jgi:hypothetical protein